MSFLARGGYLPHGYCFTWSPGLLWTMVGADAVVALAYFSIPVAILYFVRRRPGTVVHTAGLLFAAFIISCGLTHLMDIWTIWRPDYGLQAIVKVVTAALSAATAIAVWKMMPQALAIPRVESLSAVIRALEAEVSRRRTAEEQASDTEQHLALALASIDAGLIATDLQGRVVRMNEVAERLTGWRQAEALGRSYWDVFVQEERIGKPPLDNVVQVIADRGFDTQHAHRVVAVARDGRRTPVEVTAGLARDPQGTVRGALSLVKDMSRLDRAEEDLRRLAAIVESSSDAIIGKTLEGRITNWNPAAEVLFGYSESEALGQSVRMLIPDERADEEMRILANLVDGRKVPPFDTVRLAKDGRRLDLSITISPIRDGHGRIVGGAKIARDIGEQKRMVAALRESEERLAFSLEVAQIGSWEVDLETGQARHSPRHDKCFGYDQALREWSFPILLSHVHPEDREHVQRSFQDAVARGGDWGTECRVVWPDGSVHTLSLHASNRGQVGGRRQMLGIVSDITDQRRAEETRLLAQRLENENRQIQESNRLKSQFLANMSHELRSPLNAIIGFSDLLYGEALPVPAEQQHTFIGHIRTSGRHLLQLINDVLDLSKVESGKFEFFPEPLEVPAVVQEVVNVLFTPVQRKRLKVDIAVQPAVATIIADPARLKQALYNYLSNAIKFTQEGGHISIRALAEGDTHVRIEVEDTGMGIAAEDLPRLFVEFQQLDDSYTKRHEGTGLGLALTRRLVEAQGGSVGVRSQPGEGSVFHLLLPIVPELAQPERDRRLLVVLDDLRQQTRVVQALARGGIAVDLASSTQEAGRHASLRTYDGLMLDLLLENGSGLLALSQVRSQRTNSASPVVALAANTTPRGPIAFAVADVLGKPLRAGEVAATLLRAGVRPGPDQAVMVVDDDPVALALMRDTLGQMGLGSICFEDGQAALAALAASKPAAIVLDLMMPDFDGFMFLDALSTLGLAPPPPVFVWTAMVLSEADHARLARSARDIVLKGGGDLDALIDRLRTWNPRGVAQPGVTP